MLIKNPASGPHTHSGNDTTVIMLTVFLALLPALAYGVYLFGWPALNLLVVTVLTAYICEYFALILARKPLSAGLPDGSALLTACLLAISLPPWAPWWIGVFGGAFAILIGKHVFGGIGQNVFNPAMLARVALLVAFPLEMTTWIRPQPITAEQSPGFLESLNITFAENIDLDSVSSASVLGQVKTGFTQGQDVQSSLNAMNYDLGNALLGMTNGSLGETSALLILLGGLFLLYKRIISWHIPLAMLATVALLAGVFSAINPEHYLDVSTHLFNGGLMLGAFFIATDPVTSPSTKTGQLIFGAGCGALDFIIRSWGGYPEGIGFAVLLMNAVTPLIDHYIRPRIYGRDAKGQPTVADSGGNKE